MVEVEERFSEVFSRLLSSALAGNRTIGERTNNSGSREQQPSKDPRYNDKSASIVTKMECMLIAAHGEEHDPETKAIPKEEMDTNEAITRIEGLDIPTEGGAVITDFYVVRHLLKEDKLKDLKYEFEERNGEQKPRQFYMDKIVELFQNCKEPGGGYLSTTSSTHKPHAVTINTCLFIIPLTYGHLNINIFIALSPKT